MPDSLNSERKTAILPERHLPATHGPFHSDTTTRSCCSSRPRAACPPGFTPDSLCDELQTATGWERKGREEEKEEALWRSGWTLLGGSRGAGEEGCEGGMEPEDPLQPRSVKSNFMQLCQLMPADRCNAEENRPRLLVTWPGYVLFSVEFWWFVFLYPP